MNLALALALVAATLNLATAAAQWRISRAPGWRRARLMAALAASAGLYSCLNLVFSSPGLSEATYLLAARLAYLVGAAHSVGWLIFAFGGPGGSYVAMPRPARVTAAVLLTLTVVFTISGVHLSDHVQVVDVALPSVRYHYAVATPIGEMYGLAVVGLLVVPFLSLSRRVVAGESDLIPQVVGFAVFFSCAILEILVANRTLQFLSPLDVGFLAIILPTSLSFERRFRADAERLSELTGQLAGEVRQRTEELGRAQQALAEAERLAIVGRLAARVGHEITNPLSYLKLALDELRETLAGGPGEAREAVELAIDGTRRIERVVEDLRTSARGLEPPPHEPRDTAPYKAGDHATVRQSVPPPVSPRVSNAHRRRLLLIDDEPLVRELLARRLGKKWDVAVADSGAAGLEQLRAARFDAIVCDLMMPGMTGIDLAAHVAAEFPSLRPRMVFLTGGAVTGPAEEFLARPDVRAIYKPASLVELNAALDAVVSPLA